MEKNTTTEYVRYGEEWKTQLLKLRKDQIINVASGIGKEKEILEEKVGKINTLLRYINNEISELDPKDSEGHIWWNKFKELTEFVKDKSLPINKMEELA